MAANIRRLVLVLTMVALSVASIRTGSSSSGWWGSPGALRLRQAARRSVSQGNFDEAERAYRDGADLAAAHRDSTAQAWFLEGAGDASLAGFHYRAALTAYLEAKQAAERARDRIALGAVDANLASLYQEMGDVESALRAAEEARNITSGAAGVYYRPQLLLLLGRLRDDDSSVALFRESIQSAHDASVKDPSYAVVEAAAWDFLCQALLQRDDVDGAEAAEQRSAALRRAQDKRDLGFSEWMEAELRIRQAARAVDRAAKLKLLEEARSFNAAAAAEKRGPAAYVLTDQRGRILLQQGREREALEALEQAIVQAQRWRAGMVASPDLLDSAAARLQADLFNGFIAEAAAYGIAHHDPRWIAESLEAAELNRAVNLRDSAWSARQHGPPVEYWQVLEQLRAEQISHPQEEVRESPTVARLRLKLTEMEARTGVGYSPKFRENFPSQASLIHFQASLRDTDLFLSVAMGDKGSLLWAVTRRTLRVYRLPPGEQIVTTVRAFRQAIQRAETQGIGAGTAGGRLGASSPAEGRQLYAMLFGQLRRDEASKPDWRLSVDDILLEVPFAALVAGNDARGKRDMLLAGKHSVQMEAGALNVADGAATLPRSSRTGPSIPAGFVGVGDPIYNAADPRWSGTTSMLALHSILATSWESPGGGELNRLPGTGREVENSAQVWRSAGAPVTILTGVSATRAEFFKAIATAPRYIHLATHTVARAGDEAALVLSLGRDGRPETVSAAEIRNLRVPGAVVVMTGCDTAPSDAPAGLGIAGLVRAWIIAGASAVIATEWPVEDIAGSALLTGFYRHLQRDPRMPVPEALARSQTDALNSGGSSAWAAYQVFTGHIGSGSEAP